MYRFTYESARWDIDAPEVYEQDSSWRNRRDTGSEVFGGRWFTMGREVCVLPYREVDYYWDANDDGASHRLGVNC